MFVLGKVPDASANQTAALVEEQRLHGDLLEVTCQENCLVNGKTFLMYLRMYQLVRARPCCRNGENTLECSLMHLCVKVSPVGPWRAGSLPEPQAAGVRADGCLPWLAV